MATRADVVALCRLMTEDSDLEHYVPTWADDTHPAIEREVYSTIGCSCVETIERETWDAVIQAAELLPIE